jgi:hypothetical protein
MHISKYKNSRFLTKNDVKPEVLVTITGFTEENVSLPGDPPKKKLCLHFEQFDKTLVCNFTNLELIAESLGSEEMNDWIGKSIILYFDLNVMFAGKRVGGIRVKLTPKAQEETVFPVPA